MEYNRPAGRFGLYAVMIALILMGYLFLSRQTDTQSNYTLEQMQTALKEGKVLQAAARTGRFRLAPLSCTSPRKGRNASTQQT